MGKRRKPIDRDTTLNVLVDICFELMAHPDQFEMDIWGGAKIKPVGSDPNRFPCGTVMCLAGHATYDDRIPLYPVWYKEEGTYLKDGELIRTAWSLGVQRFGDKEQDTYKYLRDAFVEMCGLTFSEARFLFSDYPENDAAELLARVLWLQLGRSVGAYKNKHPNPYAVEE